MNIRFSSFGTALLLLLSVLVSSQVAAEDYVLGQGDKISIQVFDEPDLTMDAQISASGVINYSYLGDIQVSGKTSQELEAQITALLRTG